MYAGAKEQTFFSICRFSPKKICEFTDDYNFLTRKPQLFYIIIIISPSTVRDLYFNILILSVMCSCHSNE